MSVFRPLSKRGVTDPKFDGPQEGLPDYLVQPCLEWLEPLLWEKNRMTGGNDPNDEALKTLQLVLRMERPLSWKEGGYTAIYSLKNRIVEDREFALDVLDFFVQKVALPSYADKLDEALTIGGSIWEVAHISDDERHLVQRVVGPVGASIQALQSESERAHHHLSVAWQKLVGRNPDPSGAYREAIRAVEAVAKPVVTPKDPTATLGKIIAAIRDKPEKWKVSLNKASPLQVADMADLIWRGQQDRHGTDDPDAVLNVTQEEADAAVHLALALARLFASGGMSQA